MKQRRPIGRPPGPTDPDDPDVRSYDFAAEHEDVSLADEREGGPERAREDESPRGRAGQD